MLSPLQLSLVFIRQPQKQIAQTGFGLAIGQIPELSNLIYLALLSPPPFQPEQLYNSIIIKIAYKQKEPVLFTWYTEEVFTSNTSIFLSNKKDALSQTILTTTKMAFLWI